MKQAIQINFRHVKGLRFDINFKLIITGSVSDP